MAKRRLFLCEMSNDEYKKAKSRYSKELNSVKAKLDAIERRASHGFAEDYSSQLKELQKRQDELTQAYQQG